MKPIYFPFTFISPTVFKDIRIFFPQTVLYQPSSGKVPEYIQNLGNEGLLDIRIPFLGEEEKLDRLAREYKVWIEQHKGSDTAFFKSRLFDTTGFESIPMYSDTSTSQIKSDIKKGGTSNCSQQPDPVFTARLFLLTAQEFDIQADEFKKDLEKFHLMEHSLYTNIRGEDEFTEVSGKSHEINIPDDPGLHKTGQRLAAWLKLFEHDSLDPDEYGSVLFITSSPGVMDHIMDICPDNEMVLSTGKISTDKLKPEQIFEFQKALQENLLRISRDQSEKKLLPLPEMGKPDNGAINLKILSFPRKSLGTLFKEKFKLPEDTSENTVTSKFKKIFIGIVERLHQ